MFKVNYDEVKEFGDIEPGEYEVLVHTAIENVTNNGAIFMDIQLVIRNDIQQKFKNFRIFHKVFQSKATGEYHSGFVNAMAKAFQIPDGQQFNSVNDLLNNFKGKTAKIRVENREYNGKNYADVKQWYVSSFPQVNHQWKTEDSPSIADFNPVSNDDIPF
ncbi:DUF669 domain-containing protein [Tissierella creatinophila]|uniref:DUF669 domain-containing protein n=1 Tax=Tissierella creatinophila DSM 6911 TaxID=1123403 RepID=A0A1U7M4N6_TISCR|nr:DUF669 domain-containing protein [Tissierella creatinophila]OLS02246.1 hypothetical protein TICRE_17770 [Tissierella creatinophila DSM 6911]